MIKRTGIIQPGIKIECDDFNCGSCRFKIEKRTVYPFVDVVCLLYDKLITSFDPFFKKPKITRLPECITCEVLYDEEKGYVPYK